LTDIATAQPSLQKHLPPLRAQNLIRGKLLFSQFTSGDENRLSSAWNSLQYFINVHLEPLKVELQIRAVATFEPSSLVNKKDGDKGYQKSQLDADSRKLAFQVKSTGEDSTGLDDREKLRRMRISTANKGNTPWNKGRKHSAETIQRIRENTRLAMQNPKVKEKLANLGHAQSEDTRIKIGVGVRMGWQRRRQKLMVQETCYFEWQNLIAEASRRGFAGEEELLWDSYKILSEQLEKEWTESVERRRMMRRPKGSKRAPKSLEQRRKIAEAIAAKWADPDYRDRVCSALAKYHGTPAGAGRKPKRRPSGVTESGKQDSTKKKASDTKDYSKGETKNQLQQLRLRKRSTTPLYKDPLVSSKLEMIKNIRAQRDAAESKKIEAIERARLLIAEAEKAAEALEVAAMSPVARASLMETRKLIAEAIRLIESIGAGQIMLNESGSYPAVASTEQDSWVGNEIDTENRVLNDSGHKVNGILIKEEEEDDLSVSMLNLRDILKDEQELLPRSSNGFGLCSLELEGLIKEAGVEQLEANGNIKLGVNGAKVEFMKEQAPSK
ncbi:LOW QUALITY PROTEIN: hypothetical protein CFOL_v3_30741, partial [Cephalotus follicularis]